MQDKIKTAMIGLGGFGAFRRARMRDTECFDLVAVADRDPETLEKAAAEENAVAYTDFDAMLEHPGLEAAVISTGADSHARFAIAAMRAGLHVFIEKPLCCSVEEGRTLREVAGETGRVVGVGHNHCASDPLLNLAKQYMEEGRLGTVTAFEENSSHSGGLEIKPGEWRGLADRNPGGMLFQCGVHALHALAYLFGPVDSVQAMMRYDANPDTETADAANVLLQCPNGRIGTLNCYHITGYCHELRIFGTKGNLYMDTLKYRAWFQPRRRGQPEERTPVDVPEPPKNHGVNNLLSWIEGIRHGADVYPGLEDGLNAVLPVFAAEQAAKTQTATQIG